MTSNRPGQHDLSESSLTMPSDSENYEANNELSDSPPPDEGSPLILYTQPTVWSLLRGAAINLVLPFINGLMLGFGELFAHEIAFNLGWSETKQSLPQWHRKSSLVPSLSSASLGLRFNSTTPSQTSLPDASSQTHTEPTGSFEQINFDELANFGENGISTISEHIGFLRELGVEYNWGARATIEWTLEHIHVLAGTPWWLSIVVTTVLFRVICLPFTMSSSNSSARMAAMRPVIAPIQEKLKRATLARDDQMKQAAMREMADIYKSADTNPVKMLLPALVPMWIGISSFNLLRTMSTLPVPGFLDGGFLWVQNLTQADPYHILPLVSSGLIYYLLKSGGETGVQNDSTFSKRTMNIMRIVFPVLALIFTNWVPAAVQLTIVAATIWGGIQARFLRSPRFRELAGLYPIITGPPSSSTPSQQPKIRITSTEVKRGAESIVNPLKTYQAPERPKKTMIQSARGEMAGAISEMKQSLWRTTGGMLGDKTSDTEQRVERNSSREFKKKAEQYEKKKTAERQDEVWVRQAEQKMFRSENKQRRRA
ncbi:MAG: hypothetical protein Q9165_003253 [Trypethelium subeluteriae]